MDLPEHTEQELPTKLQLAVTVAGRGLMLRRGFGRVKDRKSILGSAKKGGEPCSVKSDLTTAQEVSRDPHTIDQSLTVGASMSGSIRLVSVRSRDCADWEMLKLVRIMLLVSVVVGGCC